MNVTMTPPVEMALRTLGDEDRQRVWAWFNKLKNWRHDSSVREESQKLGFDSVYVLRAGKDIRIFFRPEQTQIVILDLATKSTILSFGHSAVAGQRRRFLIPSCSIQLDADANWRHFSGSPFQPVFASQSWDLRKVAEIGRDK